MGIPSRYLTETMSVYRYKATAVPSFGGSMPAINYLDTTNFQKVGEVGCNINSGDSLEPDIRGSSKSYGVDLSSMWLGWLDIPDGFEIYVGDMLINEDDTTRKFIIQFLDRKPGGMENHHYEARLQTTESFIEN